MNKLRRLDLNLLVTLDVLLKERNVTRTAQRLNLSQPSVSVHLAKLRDVFNDPLLLPGPRGMLPTAKALELREPLQHALEALEHAVSPSRAFNPLDATRTWRIAATDYSESTVLLPALAKLRTDAPHTQVAVVEMSPMRIARQLEEGDIDLAFHTTDGSLSSLRRRPLFTEHYVLAARSGHPRLKRKPTLAQFCSLDHVIVSPDGGGFFGGTDRVLSSMGLSRRVVLSVPHFLFMMAALVNTDMVAMLPERLVRNVPALQTVEPPVQVQGFEMSMFWHERVHRDPAHRWLRELIAGTG